MLDDYTAKYISAHENGGCAASRAVVTASLRFEQVSAEHGAGVGEGAVGKGAVLGLGCWRTRCMASQLVVTALLPSNW